MAWLALAWPLSHRCRSAWDGSSSSRSRSRRSTRATATSTKTPASVDGQIVVDDAAHLGCQSGRRVLPQEPTQVRCIADGFEALRAKQVLHRRAVTRSSWDPHDPGLLALRRREQGIDKRAPVTAAATAQLKAGEPELVATIQSAEQPEADRRVAAMAVVRPEDVARHGHRFKPPCLRILLDEVAVRQYTLQFGEEVGRL